MAAFFSKLSHGSPLLTAAFVGAGLGGLGMSYRKKLKEGRGGGKPQVLSHDGLVQVSENVWQVSGEMFPWIPLSKYLFYWDTNMTIFRPSPPPFSSLPPSPSAPLPLPFEIEEDSLILHNAVAMREEEMKKLERLGTPAILIIPRVSHARDAMFYKARYPNLVIVCPSEIIDFINNDVPVDHSAEEILPSLGIKCYAPPLMTRYTELVLEIPLGDPSCDGSSSEGFPLPPSSALLFCEFMVSKMRASALVSWIASLYGVDTNLPYPQRSTLFDSFASPEATQTMQEWTEANSSSWENAKILLFTHGCPLEYQRTSILQKEKEKEKELASALVLESGGEGGERGGE